MLSEPLGHTDLRLSPYPCDQELELINRTKEGREVTYHLTESGKEILNSED